MYGHHKIWFSGNINHSVKLHLSIACIIMHYMALAEYCI